MDGVTALIDGDILVYRVGFSSESRYYNVKVVNRKTKVTADFDFKSLKDARAFMDQQDHQVVLTMLRNPIMEHESLARLRTMVYGIVHLSGCDSYQIFLTDEDIHKNFRSALDPEYKQNRKDMVKPIHYGILRKALLEDGAELVSGIEADDALGISHMHCDTPTVICSIDKDLRMIPGMHYHIVEHYMERIEDPGYVQLYKNGAGDKRLKGGGFKWFCALMLLGDLVDNIPGVRGIGPVKAFNLLNPLTTYKDMWSAIVKTYQDKKMDKRLFINAELLWVRRDPDETFFQWYTRNI